MKFRNSEGRLIEVDVIEPEQNESIEVGEPHVKAVTLIEHLPFGVIKTTHPDGSIGWQTDDVKTGAGDPFEGV